MITNAMRPTVALLGALLLAGCGKGSRSGADPQVATAAPPETATTDALLALATADTRFALVATARGLELGEAGAARLRAITAKTPALDWASSLVSKPLPGAELLAAGGHVRARGLAVFHRDAGEVFVFAVEDRARFVAARGGALGADGWDRVLELSCRAHADLYACSADRAGVEQLGTRSLREVAHAGGERGDVELVLAPDPTTGGLPFAGGVVALQLAPGQLVLHAHLSVTLPPTMAWLSKSPAPLGLTDVVGAAGLAFDGEQLARSLPDGAPIADLLPAIRGPLTMTIRPGEGLRGRLPIVDPAPLRALIQRCGSLTGPEIVGEVTADGCRLTVPGLPAPMEVRVLDQAVELAMVARPGPPGASPPLTGPGKAMLSRPWQVVAWGRGTLLGSPFLESGGAYGPIATLVGRLAELGLAIETAPDHVRIFAVIRTIDANPPDVVAALDRLLTKVAAGEASRDEVAAVAAAHPRSPFAQDLAAGELGPTLPTAMLGTLAAVAIPAFMDYQRRGKPVR